jgi:outer membrane protein OmpA-like peptidoglycan-associated protein
MRQHLLRVLCVAAAWAGTAAVVPPRVGGQEAPERIDYLTFANGAVPVRVSPAAAALGVTIEKSLLAIDGNPSGYVLSLKPVAAEADTEFVYRLPALTTFDRFAVPSVLETPSAFQTFTRLVEVHGSPSGPDEGYVLLGSATLSTHKGAGELTELTVASKTAVRFVKVRLVGGILVERDASFFQFSEIVGNGAQEVLPLSDRFTGAWQGRGVAVRLRQRGAAVAGCYDDGGVLDGTVTGDLLRATGTHSRTGVKSLFLVTVLDNNELLGVRSTNGAPFRLYTGAAADEATAKCPAPPPPVLGCGAIIHGITFGYDSAEILPDSEPVLAMLHDGLAADASATVIIEGHTSSEGTEAYNRALSERRAASVVADLVRRGLPAARLSPVGVGESRPIAPNTDETGRSLNRRVEVRCQ